jgi:hypothetical protein
METRGKGGQLHPRGQGKEKKERVREVVIEGRNRGNNRRKEGGKVLAYCHRAIRAG